jgi:RNA polymerase sigma-70 factor (ECF subfamily)
VSEFEEIYRANVGAITAFFARRTSDPHTVADLTSDTFVEAITAFGTFDPSRGTARAWLFGIARHVHLRHCGQQISGRNALRQLAGRRELDGDQVEELLRRIDAEQAGRDLMRRWQRLPPTDRLAVELVDIVGLAPREAAAAVGVSSGALRIRLFRARAKLRGAARKGDEHGEV